jgi:hypothetical protein
MTDETNGAADGAATATVAKKKKPNSPKAPGMALRAAMNEVAKIYGSYSHSSFTRGEMASAVGMSAGSGSFFAKAATLNGYGLLEEAGGNVRVSPLFKALYQAPAGSPEMKRNAFQAIGKPSVFAGLLRAFGQRIPEESVIALRLEMQSNFNRDRAQEVATAFRSSLADYGLIDGNGNLLPVRDDASNGADAPDDEDEAIELGPPAGAKAPSMPTSPGTSRVEVPLANGRKAIVALPDDVTEADAKKICAILTAYATS